MPEPIIDPITIIVASSKLKPRTSFGLSAGAFDLVDGPGAEVIMRFFRSWKIFLRPKKRADDISITDKDQ
jgi:hypothetical protein